MAAALEQGVDDVAAFCRAQGYCLHSKGTVIRGDGVDGANLVEGDRSTAPMPRR